MAKDTSAKKLAKILKDLGIKSSSGKTISEKEINTASKKSSSGGSVTNTPAVTTPAPYVPLPTSTSAGLTQAQAQANAKANLAAMSAAQQSGGSTPNNIYSQPTVDTSVQGGGISDAEIEQLRLQGYTEGSNVPGRGILMPDGTFKPATTTPTGESTMSVEQFTAKLKELGIIQTPAPETTPGLLGLIPGETDLDTKIQEGEDNLLKIKQELAKPETDEAMRARLTALFQSEIDALNAVYAQQKQEALKAGLGALGTNRASQARFGLLGSSFGTAETQGVEAANLEKVNAVDTAKNAALAPIYSTISNEMIKAKKEKQAAQQTSAEAYIENLKSQKEKKATIATNAIKAMILNKSNPTDKDFTDMAKQIGVDPVLFKQEYLAAKKEDDTETAKAEQTAAKAKQDAEKVALDMLKDNVDITKPYESGGYIWQYNPNTGSVENIGSARSVANTDTNKNNYTFAKADETALLSVGETSESIQALQDAISTYGIEAVINDAGVSDKTRKQLKSIFNL
jgi:hypothetical protein